ncbi:MAG: thioredoxin family protein [Gammaproteobacteria bacterium]|nr:thioredoxin family protein [Gammaproteobacteria bacterium]NBT44222.1 thioredoxin family protein [Gammaproteobacteria bacterium]NBY22056.1 thioredoxin family protein [Gammaproteobacteria bacterium]NDE33730.1 thioredoxin family protein [Gammaproteobacteria bacterium]NDE55754.1 thioredoxin family protein [Gammaproteobacteria bacterium]
MALVETPLCDFGAPAIDFALQGVDGRIWTLADCRGPKGLLVMFLSNHCPYVKAIQDRLVRDTLDLKALGVETVAIMSNDTEDYPEDGFENMQRIAFEKGYDFPYLLDDSQNIAKAYGAVCTPDFFGYNTALELQYRGRLDASGRAPRPKDAPRELFEAMQSVSLTGQGPRQQFPSMGCSIKWRPHSFNTPPRNHP